MKIKIKIDLLNNIINNILKIESLILIFNTHIKIYGYVEK